MKKVVLVTGGSKGIGLATALRFLQEGFQVVICARHTESLPDVYRQHPAMDVLSCDITLKSDIDKLATQVDSRYGGVHVLVNNAGVFLPGRMSAEDDTNFERMLHTNLFGAYYLTKRLLPAMISRRSGTIVNICSTASITPFASCGSYCISKYALLGFSKSLREEMKPHGIRVVSVLPGATLTDSWSGTNLPPERFVPVADIAETIWQAHALSKRSVVEEILIRPLDGDITT